MSLHAWGRLDADRILFAGLLFAVVALVVAAMLCLFDVPWDIDNGSYVNLALGRVSEVYRPYANRMLHPLMVRGVAAALGQQPVVGVRPGGLYRLCFLRCSWLVL